MTQTIKKFRNLLTFAMLLAFMMVIPSITAKASTYDYTINGTTRSLSIINGETTLTADGKTYNLTRQLVAADAAIDQYGTTWILFKNGAVYWWSYDLEKDSTQVEIHKLFSSTGNQVYAEKFLFEGADEVTVTGYQTSSGSKFSLLTLEEIKLLLNITDSSTVTTEKSTSSGNTSSTVTTEKYEQWKHKQYSDNREEYEQWKHKQYSDNREEYEQWKHKQYSDNREEYEQWENKQYGNNR